MNKIDSDIVAREIAETFHANDEQAKWVEDRLWKLVCEATATAIPAYSDVDRGFGVREAPASFPK